MHDVSAVTLGNNVMWMAVPLLVWGAGRGFGTFSTVSSPPSTRPGTLSAPLAGLAPRPPGAGEPLRKGAAERSSASASVRHDSSESEEQTH